MDIWTLTKTKTTISRNNVILFSRNIARDGDEWHQSREAQARRRRRENNVRGQISAARAGHSYTMHAFEGQVKLELRWSDGRLYDDDRRQGPVNVLLPNSSHQRRG